MAEELRQRYDRETDIRYAAARLWVDAIIDPAQTREVLIMALDVATRNREATRWSWASSRSESVRPWSMVRRPLFAAAGIGATGR